VKKPELLAPGGSFLAAFHAFEAGADGVYLGPRQFSARAAAQNFSLEQLRRIRQLAADRGRTMYVTLNTVVREGEWDQLRETLSWLEALRVDGVILQDLGVCDMARRDFPGLSIHASTQMGVHNDSGLDVAETMGIRRAILSRELPLERIRALRAGHPRMELEVFIHGALCYSFSGACLASWSMTGRSGNRGECAQVCRSLFTQEGGDSGAPKHLFSTRDLFLGRDVLKLAEIGVDALKIEGRMKSPEYVFNVTRLYREVLDRGEGLPSDEYEDLVRRSELGFSRTKTSGWFHAARGSRLIEPGSPGHRGALMGRIDAVQGAMIVLRLQGDLSLHDGLVIVPDGSADQAAFSVHRIVKSGREVKFARRGETVSIEIPREGSQPAPHKGQEVRHLSSRFLDLPEPREASFNVYKISLDMRIAMHGGGAISIAAQGFPECTRPVTVSAANTRTPFLSILADLLEQSGDSVFRPGILSLENDSGFPDDGIFIRPSELKKVKNELYAFLDSGLHDWLMRPRARGDHGVDDAEASDVPISPLGPADLAILARRDLVGPKAMAPVPFVGGDPARLELSALVDVAGFFWLPLPPVLMDDGLWIKAVRNLLDGNPGVKIAIGLNNISHLAFADAFSNSSNAWFFGDFYMYSANDNALHFLRRRVRRFLFAYEWVEEDEASAHGPRPAPTIRMSRDFRPPLFYSLACFARHSMNEGRCVDECPKDFSGDLRQGRNRFRMLVRDCVTYLFER
jgi:putative protease